MPPMSEHQSAKFTKLLLMGESSSGKTGALFSLVEAGYTIGVLDFDNGLDILAGLIRRKAPERMSQVFYETIRDKLKSGPQGPIADGPPTAMVSAVRLLDNWPEHGPAKDWGDKHILVIDSLTFMSQSAMNWADAFTPYGKSGRDERNVFYTAQKKVENILGLLTSEAFRTNVIVTAHVQWNERQDGTTKGYPNGPGKALGPIIPAYFNTMALVESVGTPPKRSIRTVSTALIDLKNAAAFKLEPTLPLETGLATIFKELRT